MSRKIQLTKQGKGHHERFSREKVQAVHSGGKYRRKQPTVYNKYPTAFWPSNWLYSAHHEIKVDMLLILVHPFYLTHKLLYPVSFLDAVSSDKPGWSSWSDFGPCSSHCRKIRQRFCASHNKDVDCPGHSYGVESQEVACPSQECSGK